MHRGSFMTLVTSLAAFDFGAVPLRPSAEQAAADSSPSAAADTTDGMLEAGVRGVVYGLPLVLMDLTMRQATNASHATRGFAAPVNQFANSLVFPSSAFTSVVRANVDTLYSSAFLDLSAEPVVLSVPETDRYYLLPILDAWTNVIATPGTRTTGTNAGRFAITGPGWTGTLPSGVSQVKSPTNMAWILGRTQTNGPADYPGARAVQRRYKLVPLSAFGSVYEPPDGTIDPTIDMQTPPIVQLEKMPAAEFFARLALLLKANPPLLSDAGALADLARLGIVAGQPFDAAKLDPAIAHALEPAVKVALQRLHVAARGIGTSVNGWRIPPANLGNYGSDDETRAVIALIAFGANLPADAVYPTTFVDGDGNALNGAHRYVLRFAAGQTPPVNAFWSVTMYDTQSFFIANPLDRFAISSWMPLRPNADGSLDILIQRESPGSGKEANWLPCGAEAFNLTLRMYWPKTTPPSIIDASWRPPAIIKVAAS